MEKVQERLDLKELNELVTGSVREGFRHLTRLVEDYHAGANRFDQTGEALFLCRLENKIVGICGLNRDPYYGEGLAELEGFMYIEHIEGMVLGISLQGRF
ncbi:GNAT family N-acetyltransferase [Paenibacillus lutrae]|uniref:GNAT family N-acetyltransferase n=1 Tax=Paenibacillus lutrae TaxID=2078573 RepID=UPI001F34CE55|nr:GNAT family N-acetyltransferase [Paenibacillus lutrae]